MNSLKALLLASTLLTGSLAVANPDPQTEQEAEQLLEAIGVKATLEQATTQMVNLQVQQTPALAPLKGVMTTYFHKYASYESLRPEFIKAYSEAFTLVELQEMNEFYSSPVGQKAAQKLPELMRQVAQIGVTRVQANMGELQTMMQAEAQKIEALQKQVAPAEKP